MTKKCFFDSCRHEFQGSGDLYETCPDCGSATIPIETKNDIDKEISKASNKYHKEALSSSRYSRFFKCPFGYECQLLGNYEPNCEQKVFKHECLIPIHQNQYILEMKLDKILALLNPSDL